MDRLVKVPSSGIARVAVQLNHVQHTRLAFELEGRIDGVVSSTVSYLAGMLHDGGKTTLLKAVVAFEVEGMPRHHRILHLRQEIRATGEDVSVMNTVFR